jgi:hypothetical protein
MIAIARLGGRILRAQRLVAGNGRQWTEGRLWWWLAVVGGRRVGGCQRRERERATSSIEAWGWGLGWLSLTQCSAVARR